MTSWGHDLVFTSSRSILFQKTQFFCSGSWKKVISRAHRFLLWWSLLIFFKTYFSSNWVSELSKFYNNQCRVRDCCVYFSAKMIIIVACIEENASVGCSWSLICNSNLKRRFFLSWVLELSEAEENVVVPLFR